MGKYLNVEEESEKDFLQREGTVISEEDMLKFTWNAATWLVAQIDLTYDSPAIVCYHKRELAYIQRTTKTEPQDITYYLVLSKKLLGRYE